ncbi:MAG: diadenylate cyclase [Desulfobacterales bacterium]|nr:MAG: diadenylate cyclase [Desulfobacterales bacterium]
MQLCVQPQAGNDCDIDCGSHAVKDDFFSCQCIVDTVDGLRDGLSHFSGPSRAAVIYALMPDDPVRIYDPQNLLQGHEPRFKELYLDSQKWRSEVRVPLDKKNFGYMRPEKNLQLAGLISYGGRSGSVFYQMWFTEHHPDMCSIGPTERWLEHAAWRFSHDIANEKELYTGISGHFLREYGTHAVRDHIIDEMNMILGWDTHIRVYPILDAILAISRTREEGEWPVGELLFVESRSLAKLEFVARFPEMERPNLENYKHVRKLLLAVEDSARKLVSDGKTIVGIATGALPEFCILADFRGRYGFLELQSGPVCSFADGSFKSTTHKAKLVHIEEALLEADMDPVSGNRLFKIIASLVHNAENSEHGCTLVIDLNHEPLMISGQKLASPLDLQQPHFLELAQSLSKVDGALHIGADLNLHGFACLLDGRAIAGEDRARGARFNSALRFTAEHQQVIVVVVSSDRPVAIIQEGVELSAQCYWKPYSTCRVRPPTLQAWIAAADP